MFNFWSKSWFFAKKNEDIFDNFHPLCRKSNLDLGLVSNSTLISTQSGHKNWSETSLVIDEKTNFDVGTWETRNENDCD